MKKIVLVLLLLTNCAHAQSVSQTAVREWKPDEIATWSLASGKNPRLENGAFSFETQAGDSQLISPVFAPLAASPWQRLEVEIESDVSGPAQLFWTGTTEGKYGGFAGEKATSFSITTGRQLYRIEPFWQTEKQILRLRFDFPEERAGHYKITALRIVEDVPGTPLTLPQRDLKLDKNGLWRGRINWPAGRGAFVTLRLAAKGDVGALGFASDAAQGFNRMAFPLRGDGKMHTYNIDAGADADWRGNIIALQIEAGAEAKLESLTLGAEPQGAPDLEVTFLGTAEPLARSGKPQKIEAIVRNHGGEAAHNLKAQLQIDGAKILKSEAPPAAIEWGIPETLTWTVQADKPGVKKAQINIPGAAPFAATLDFKAPVKLPQANYVPVPRPVKSDYQVGVYYFPGWHTSGRWAPLKSFPERKPLLGFYREGDPEVADWQIKWAVEHGIGFFLYDWYWDRGTRQLEQGLDALFKARYQHLIKFALLYANHNGAGSHSAADFERMTRFWIENYFKRPNHLMVDGKPVVVIFAPSNPVQDMGAEAVKTTFEKMRALCREAGFKGLYLVACSNENPALVAKWKELGYDAVSAYNWAGSGMTAAERAAQRAPYASGVTGYKATWESLANANHLKVIPPIFAGWDPRPWHGGKSLVRYGRSPSLFKQHLQDAKAFLEAREADPQKRLLFIEAWNEWGEGSYIEPHREFGFGYLEAIRQVFAPTSTRPAEIVPADVGRGPYDVPESRTQSIWHFDKDAEGWSGNVETLRAENGALRFVTRGRDPVLISPSMQARAAQLPYFILRIKASRDVEGQLFWSTPSSPVSEGNSVRFAIRGDNQWHDVKIRLADNARWRGVITSLRFDPGWLDGVDCAIESIGLAER